MSAPLALPFTRILGIDPGLRITGFGVIERQGSQLHYIASGCIKSPDGSLPERLKVILAGVQEVVDTYHPAEAAVEIVFVNVNPQSTLLLGQARGAAICGLVSRDLPVAEYTALQVKQAVVGYGKANKEQVQHMVKRLLQLEGDPQADAADALAVAISHAHGGSMAGGLATAVKSARKRGARLTSLPVRK
ncbi:crossover junction endodeoxyribonuclease RuvC [Uliginosibacterium sp. 31-16]|uniref:crossover junction endodeoxyribonuclease RuvC n=1 Tax=Uliginosibacterium sp. 31-16 TaxID=3068315 RepID=UPI00273E29A7|nr:crossover junction endodeoxyribonuclease RuvC [Uliginosibacterium sp. 31-16]MDP5239173.1 crossover junction endodeoxyribonuclease RuvC [Uliginosibacterium sp. 31-16]